MSFEIPDEFKGGPRRLYMYPINFVGATQMAINGGTQSDNVVTQPDQITVFTHFGFVSDNNFLIQLTMSDLGGGLFKGPVAADAMLSLMDRPGEFPVPIVIQGQGSMLVEVTNDDSAAPQANNARLNFIGYRIFKNRGRNC